MVWQVLHLRMAGLALRSSCWFRPHWQHNATKDDAVATVKKGSHLHQGQRQGQVLCRRSPPRTRSSSRPDLYVVVYGMDGKCLAHGANEKQVGRDLIDLKDIDGKPFIRERVELGKLQAPRGSGRTTSSPTRRPRRSSPNRCIASGWTRPSSAAVSTSKALGRTARLSPAPPCRHAPSGALLTQRLTMKLAAKMLLPPMAALAVVLVDRPGQ